MGLDDNRSYRLFYGIYTYDWKFSFGTFADHQYFLVDEYINEGCITLDSSEASITHNFLYMHHIKKKYYIEGVVEGHITLAASDCTSTVTSYRVSVCKMNEDNTDEELCTTGWKTVNDTLAWDAALSVGEEVVYPFWIDVWDEQALTEGDRIYVKVEVNCDACTHLMHSNDSTWEDLKINIPMRL